MGEPTFIERFERLYWRIAMFLMVGITLGLMTGSFIR